MIGITKVAIIVLEKINTIKAFLFLFAVQLLRIFHNLHDFQILSTFLGVPKMISEHKIKWEIYYEPRISAGYAADRLKISPQMFQ